jgi:mRNA interferase MazF
LTRKKAHCGFVTGDLVKAVVTTGKKIGSYLGRVAVRSSGRFNIQRTGTVVQGISHKACRRLQRADDYGYAVETMKRKESAFLPGVNAEVGSRAQRMKRRGEVWVANLNPKKGGEIGKARPVLVIQNTSLEEAGLETAVILPLTTQFRPSFVPLRIRIPARDRLLRECFAVIEQIRAIDISRFSEGPLTTLTSQEMAAIERSLRAVLGLW